METAATASFAPAVAAIAGVSRLPMPKPATDATAPPKGSGEHRLISMMSNSVSIHQCLANTRVVPLLVNDMTSNGSAFT